ncbi:bifunctional folylpolyglutamate synthase/dihydrofolate synthase [Mangrovimonas spongiae]|uniref:Dihydrofolate synthase/folylpolyglutamate synthase n=1 Tax=Mangrovimonas spongiae TaxID=2494697 RepID=A0A428K2K7_9FLAO|nr:folylpolyglutamate synthase/dihydrofolate synthase family protein [Mangrovimonas spongiae]RSK40652.1 bifunctional folylpolyglutamate synthase/dihydrofolate synthase [Mangrovimonas spongiae]
MTYQETINWMFSKLPMYQRQGKSAYKADLSNTLTLAAHLNHPEQHLKTIHVAGTNGKGSTANMLASICQEAGYKTGLFTSPHLKDYRERIRINGVPVSKQFVIGFINRNKAFLEKKSLSFFEMTTLMAFDYFAKNDVDIAIIEVGLGGRLDSTNIIHPLVSVITNIGLDHTQFLGHDLATIAREKAGIIKSKAPVVIGETQKETQTVFKTIAAEKQSPIYFADQLQEKLSYKSDLLGEYQQKNIKTAVQTIAVLNQESSFKISKENITLGLRHVTKNTGLKGRWQVLQHNPKIICDTAHNVEGLSLVVNQLKKEPFDNLHIVFGVVNDKDLTSLFTILPKQATYYLCKPDIPRGMDEKKLKSEFDKANFTSKIYGSVNQAFSNAKEQAKENDLIFVGGSTFTVAEII